MSPLSSVGPGLQPIEARVLMRPWTHILTADMFAGRSRVWALMVRTVRTAVHLQAPLLPLNVQIFSRRVWLQTDLHAQHLHAQTLPLVMSLAVFFFFIIIFCLNLSTFYNSSRWQDVVVVKRSCCSVATDLYFPPTDDLQDLVCYDIKLVLIVILSPLATHTIRVECKRRHR